MSGRSRNLMHGENFFLPFSRILPEVICESPTNSPGKNFGEEISSDLTDTRSFNTRFNYNSTTSSAQSQRFQDMFYKTDWPSLSDTGTDSPDCIELEGSDSSASSMFSWADAEGTKMVAEEWEKIQRTLYNEPGPKVTQKHLIEECNQWKAIYPHIRVIGRGFGNSSLDYDDPYDTEEEVLALHYDSDVDLKEVLDAPYIMNEKFHQDSKCQKVIPLKPKKKSAKELEVPGKFSANTARSKSGTSLVEELDTLLHITPMAQNLNNNNYTYRNRSSAIIKSEITSSRWRQRNNISPDFVSLPHQTFLANKTPTRDNSAASLFSLAGARNYLNSIPNTLPSDITRNKSSYKRQTSGKKSKQNISDKHSHLLEPLERILPNRTIPNRSISIPLGNDSIKSASQKNRNVSLPPILADENTNRKKQLPDITFSGKSSRRNNKTTLTPIQMISSNIPKHNIGGDADTLSLFNDRSIFSMGKKTLRRRSSKKHLPLD